MDRTKIQGAQLEVFIGANAAPYNATVTLNPFEDIVKVFSQRYGTTPIAHLIQGHNAEVTIEFNEWDEATVRQSLNLTGSGPYLPPGVGTQPTAFSLRLHNPHAGAVTTHDIVLAEVVPMNFGMTVNGQGERKFTVTFSMQMSEAGATWQLGYTAP